MTPARRCIPYITTSMVSLVIVIVLVAISQIEKVHAFSSRSLHPTPSVVTTRTSVSSLKAVGSNSLVAVTDSNYRDLFGGKKFLLLDACAQWCGPCKLIEPVLQQCADDWKDSLVVGKFDVEDANGEDAKSRDLKVELILQGVMPKALPALILVHENKILDTWKGVISPNQLQEMLEKHVVKNKHVESIAAKSPFRGIGLVNNF